MFRTVAWTMLATFALVPMAFAPVAAAEPECVPTSGGLDYPSYLCVDTSNPKCPVYTLTTTDWGTQKKCFGVL